MLPNFNVRQVGYDTRYNTWHTQGRNMILYVHSGSGSIISRERNYPIIPGALCFVGPKKSYYTLPADPNSYVRSKIYLSDQELEKALALFPEELKLKERFSAESMAYALLDVGEQPRIAALFDELQKTGNEKNYHNALIFSQFLRLLMALDQHATDAPFPTSGIVQKAVEFINSHIHEDITIDRICDAVHVTKYYLCRKFKQSTGLTVMSYIVKTRIISAKNLMETTNLTIGQISQRCGFSSQSYFCRVFKEECGMTPLKFREKPRTQVILEENAR